MKARWWGSLMFAAVAVAAEPELQLTGILADGKEIHLALQAKGEAPRWVRIGQQVGGYTVASYDAKTETVVLTKLGQELRLRLRDSKVGAAAVEPTPEMKNAILNNLRRLAAAADQYYLENGKSTTSYDNLVGDTKYVRKIEVVAGENYRAIEFAAGKPMRVTTASGYTTSYDP